MAPPAPNTLRKEKTIQPFSSYWLHFEAGFVVGGGLVVVVFCLFVLQSLLEGLPVTVFHN